eukprot:Phypoly_transcript_06679.p1 GENE.Phypoly_transcript_06679~~Phypoly_transcript_06679.p1  ORF type:complete len:540 (+),score=92.81 Phypoly_transcript_06679:76-1695(+)
MSSYQPLDGEEEPQEKQQYTPPPEQYSPPPQQYVPPQQAVPTYGTGGYQAPPEAQQGYQQPYQQPSYQQGYQQPYNAQPAYDSYQNQPPQGHSHHHGQEYSTEGMFPEKTEYRDWPWAVLFLGHLLALLIILGVAASSKTGDNNDANHPPSSDSLNPDSDDFLPWDSMGKAFLVCILGTFSAIGFSVLYLALIKKYAKQLIKITIWAGICWCLVLAILGFAYGSILYGVIFLIFAAINFLFFYFWRQRIPFATAVLTTVARILDAYPAPTYYAYASLLVQICFILLWFPAFVVVQRYAGGSAAVLSIFLIFSFYWTSQVIKNVVHVTASGLVATWYFLSGVGMPRNPTNLAFKRATTTSFGSICLGSLLVAILKTLRQLLQSRSGSNNWLACIAACILAIIDQLIEYFNMYAFTQVAIYGKSYCRAAKDTWKLCKERGVDAIVNDNLISGVLVMGALIGGVATAVIGGIIAIIAIPEFFAALAFVCFLIGVSLVMLCMEVVESGVATIFVCFAMDPQALQRNDPALHNLFITTYHGLHV